LQWFGYKEPKPEAKTEFKGVIRLFRSFKITLKILLVSDILIRLCEGLPNVFIIIYAKNIVGIDEFHFGLLISIQMATSLVVYLPIAVLSDRFGRKPFATLTFVFFALYPLVIVMMHDFFGLILAFIVGGLREIGEPSRKAMIVDLMPETERGSSAGLYYLLRGLFVTPASFIGGLLWLVNPQTPFLIAFIVGIGGTMVFALFVKEKWKNQD
jgi:MFS family permease